MGGLLILLSMVLATLLWADLSNLYVWIVLLVTLSFGLLGFADDYLKVSKRSSAGVSGRFKLAFQFMVAGAAVYCPDAAADAAARRALSRFPSSRTC